MRITEDGTFGPDVVAFLDAHVAQMRSISPPESKHALDLDGLRRPGIAFWTVLDEEGALLGCGALAEIGPGHAELKSMRTDPACRRGGIATALLTHIVTEARLRGHRRLSLETGSDPFFAPARALYAKHGFVPCPPFGSYRPDPLSTFMTLDLTASGG
ncbi:GNAT family N-acetyltransferase [Streptomyces albidoflavus]